MRQDWIFLLTASICLVRKRYFFLGGAALTWSALLRVFPLLFFAGWGIIIGLYVIRRFRDWRSGKLAAQAALVSGKGKKKAKPSLLETHRGHCPAGSSGYCTRTTDVYSRAASSPAACSSRPASW